jgi:hypothetical protein
MSSGRAVLLIRTANTDDVVGALRAGRRIAGGRVFSPKPGWTVVRTDDSGAAAAAADLSRRLDTVVFRSDALDSAVFEVFTRGKRYYSAGAEGDLGDTDYLAPFIVPDGRLADLRRQAVTPTLLWFLLDLPELDEAAAEPGTEVECAKKRWWEFWV